MLILCSYFCENKIYLSSWHLNFISKTFKKKKKEKSSKTVIYLSHSVHLSMSTYYSIQNITIFIHRELMIVELIEDIFFNNMAHQRSRTQKSVSNNIQIIWFYSFHISKYPYKLLRKFISISSKQIDEIIL